MLWLVNDERSKSGRAALTESESLNQVAQRRANGFQTRCYDFQFDDPFNSWIPAGTQAIQLTWKVSSSGVCLGVRRNTTDTVSQLAEHIADAMQDDRIRPALLASHRREIGMGIHKDTNGYVHVVLLLK